ncbi:hypothetical protein ACLM5J_11145 [Nocardioides sp. Bht2]|uniref:hypothetical protein n=1 Tax=Nocardioides sp. Bht2 TaxID=3392297 RepID=UPI0039B50620
MRGIFFDEDDAQAVARALAAGGWSAEVVRERLAGEDDDEDHPWAVLTDAPAFTFEVLIDQHDGWLEEEVVESVIPKLPPLALPDAPRRIKRPDAGN